MLGCLCRRTAGRDHPRPHASRSVLRRSADCDEDGIPDECTESYLDCNANLVPDACELASGDAEDCNANGWPDECDIDFNASSPQLSPFDGTHPQCFTMPAPPTAWTDVTLRLHAWTYLIYNDDWASVYVNGVHIGDAFVEIDAWCYSDDEDSLIIPRDQFNELAGGQDMDVCIVPTPDVADWCSKSFVQYTLEYSGPDYDDDGILDYCELPTSLVAADPPDGIIDARQPHELYDHSPQGWQSISLTFDGLTTVLGPEHFAITELGGDGTPPAVESVEFVEPHGVVIYLAEPIEPGAWTEFTYLPGGQSTRLGFLPGDVNADGTTSATDLLTINDWFNGLITLPEHAADLNRDGHRLVPDILRLIDLLTGAGEYEPWMGRTLPPE